MIYALSGLVLCLLFIVVNMRNQSAGRLEKLESRVHRLELRADATPLNEYDDEDLDELIEDVWETLEESLEIRSARYCRRIILEDER